MKGHRLSHEVVWTVPYAEFLIGETRIGPERQEERQSSESCHLKERLKLSPYQGIFIFLSP